MKSPYEEKIWIKNYPSDMLAEIDIPVKSVNEIFDEVAEKYKNRDAIIFYGNTINFKTLHDKVMRLATALHDLGVRKGDRVAFVLLNSPEHIIALLATLRIGAVCTPVSPVYVSSEIKHQLEDSGAQFLICQDILYSAVEKTGYEFKQIILTNITESLPKLKKILGSTILKGVYQKMAAPPVEIYNRSSFHEFQDLIKKYQPNPPVVEIDPMEDIVTLPYTGGTTGKPKGVMITHYNIVANVKQLFTHISVLEEGNEVWISYMPFYHAAGQVVTVLNSIMHGFTMVVLTNPDVDEILYSIMRYKSKIFFGAPTMYEILKDYKKTDRVDWKSLKILISGADALHEYTAKDWKDRTGADICEGFGQTETSSTTHLAFPGKVRIGSVGLPLPNTLAAIVDPDKDEYMPINEIGEIVVNGPQLTKGYWKNPQATQDCVSEMNGIKWWRTGDLGYMDEDGFFYVYDRKRDLIKYKGLRVFAREVEEVIKIHPKVKEVGIIGVPDQKVGQNVKAMIVLETDARGNLSEQDIIDFCKDKLTPYKIPKIIEFVGEVPKTDIGKVSRRELREEEE
ncbi:MAG: AMP-binding protein [Bacteroidales bacterium]|nr:AMP-binding protein [Bacteroidales bacterium]